MLTGRLALLLLSLLTIKSRVIKAIGFKHNDLVVALVIIVNTCAGTTSILSMASHSAIGISLTAARMIRRNIRLQVKVDTSSTSATIDSNLLV